MSEIKPFQVSRRRFLRRMSAIAASTMSRAIARGVYEAVDHDGDLFPSWAKAFNAN